MEELHRPVLARRILDARDGDRGMRSRPDAEADGRPAAPAAARRPQPPKPKPAPVAEKVTLAADVLFDFDKAVIKPEGKERARRPRRQGEEPSTSKW